MIAQDMDGWHYDADGERAPGFLEGTAFQPDGIQDHMDAWGSVHPGDLADCLDCTYAADLELGGAP
ncbi:hypothetical protein ACH40F_08335 [Streptomyces sp. NPDC020794]|uniref:hypothetical protein n=1 Tax=unclassified Streptomyces TaxID=2593676 RepID=UPI0036E24E30